MTDSSTKKRIDKLIEMENTMLESAILGSIFMANDEYVNVIQFVTKEMFKYDPNSKIFRIITDLYEHKTAIDKVTVWSEVIARGWNSQHLSEKFVEWLAQGGESMRAKHAIFYAEALSAKFGQEVLKDVSKQIYLEMTSKPYTLETGLAKVNQFLLKASEYAGMASADTFKLDLDEESLFKDIDNKMQGQLCTGLETGIWEVDKSINGLEKGRVYNFTGAPASGKTNFALQATLNNARQGKNVLYCSFEMGVDELTLRLVCMQQNLNNWAIDDPQAFIAHHIERGKFVDISEGMGWIKKKISDGYKAIKYLNIEIFRPEDANITKIKSAIEKYILQNKTLDLVIIDHTQLIVDYKNVYASLYEIYKKLKDYAVRYDIPVLALHQFNRSGLANEDGYKPTVFALSGGQAINDCADVIMLLYRPAIYTALIEEKPELKDHCEIIYAKRRGGKLMNPSNVKYTGIKFQSLLDIEGVNR